MALPPLKHGDYSVGWICALEIERSAARCMLDEEHPNLPLSAFDQNIYSLGSIGNHNIVIACLPEGMPGTAAAATVANFMSSTFTELRFQLLVGIGGGAPKPYGEPNPRNDIRLGDIIVSRPTEGHGGVVQYDFGKAEANGEFVHKGTLRRPPLILLAAIGIMRSDERVQGLDLSKHLQRLESFPDSHEWIHQGTENDELFAPDYNHKQPKCPITKSCDDCEREHLVCRLARKDTRPAVHYGLIATANQVMKDGVKREMIRSKHNVFCFEMEAGGLDNFECLVIRGICDYSDTHKNDRWQPYAAATAAAYARELLFKIPKREVSLKPPMPSSLTPAAALKIDGVRREAIAVSESLDEQPRKRARPYDPSDWRAVNRDLVDESSNILENYDGLRDEVEDIVLEHIKRKRDLRRLNHSDVREAVMMGCWHYRCISVISFAREAEVKTAATAVQLKQLAILVKPPIQNEGAQTEKSSTKDAGPLPATTEDVLPMTIILQHASFYTRSIEYGAVVFSDLDNDQMLRAEFDGRLVDALRTWAVTKISVINYIEFPSNDVRFHENSILALQIITSAVERTPHIPVISFFCEASPAVHQIEPASAGASRSLTRPLEPMSGLVYSLAHQLLEILPPLDDATVPLKQWYKCAINNPSRDFESAIELFKITLSIAPSLLFCIIDGVDAFMDGFEEAPSQLGTLVDVMREAMGDDSKLLKVLFTNRHRVPSLVCHLRPEEMKIISRIRRTKLAGGRAPGRRQLRISFTEGK